ncbi:Thiol-specific monooxygenase [Lasiodiplodia hormozganensis]|uniref:Thiol-specific monooxygenase n=1 Tax=Lasiodiplodia hormozganensis TaxID=869390 RepID=A0AA39Z2S1_9PEZI|nr:Thiol-specific monooxygenase [Lasiodiplodia hormozganensis]
MSSANAVASSPLRFNAKKVAVVGAGPCGLAALKYLSAEKKFDRLVAFEQRSSPGGLWNYTPEDRDDGSFAVPKTKPTKEDLDKPVWGAKSTVNGAINGAVVNGDAKEAKFISPVYELLETNIPKQLMQYHDFAFPEESQLFPKHWTVDKYLKDYAKEVEHLIQFQTQVVDVKLLDSKETDGLVEEQWRVTTKNVVTGESAEEVFDAVVVANGHFYIPFIPEIEGVQEWHKAHPGSITHSKFYRTPGTFKDKKVIVVGNSASGLDIGKQIGGFCSLPLINSIKSESYMARGKDSFKKEVPPIKNLDPSTRTATFEDGTTESDIDAIVFCTGYLYSMPFLSDLQPALVTDGTRVENTYQHVFYTPHPTLSFLVLNQRIIPFQTAEVQAAVVARTLASRLTLPAAAQMRAWELHTLAVNGEGNDFHTLAFPNDADYINTMHDWAVTAEGEGSSVGKTPPRWTEWHYWCRERFPDIRAAFTGKGEERKNVRELVEVGFDFQEWKKQKELEAKELL